MILKNSIAYLFACAIFVAAPGAYAQVLPTAQQPAADQPATFSADEMTHDKELGLITARGHVEVNHGGRTLLADTISYDQTHDTIRASGSVALHNPSGEVYFADSMEVTGDLKNGMVENFRAVLADRSRFAANRAQLVNDETLTLDHAVYSPCKACQDDPSRPLLWQLKAVRIVQDRVGKTVEYQDAWLEFAGVPVMYTPYMSHPDPSVKRKSGFLAPSFGGTKNMGMVIQVPYFHVIDDSSDVTVTPLLTSKENGGLGAEYRGKFTKGEINTNGSLAYNGQQNVLGHIDAKARFDADPTWRWGMDLQRASTDTYMRRYGYGNMESLTSRGFVEGFRGDNYAAANVLAFQGLRPTDRNSTTPVALPVMEYSHRGEPDNLGAYNAFDFNFVKLMRETGTTGERVALRPSWNLPYVAPMGDVYKLSASMGMDFFHTQNLPAPRQRGSTYNGAALRATPELALDWRWPLARRNESVTEVFEPIGQVIASPYGGNSWKMANEDSQELDFNGSNLFSANRFAGYDRVEGGPRANYGLKWGVYGDQGGSTTVLVGQSYRLKKDDTFAIGSGLENNLSDYIGNLKVSPNDAFTLLYRTRVDEKTKTFNRNELGASGQAGWLTYTGNYVFFSRRPNSDLVGRKELSLDLGAQLTDTWSTRLASIRDLSSDGGPRMNGIGAVYEDECFRFDVTAYRSYYVDREIRPNDSIIFRLMFKTLGEFSTNVAPSL